MDNGTVEVFKGVLALGIPSAVIYAAMRLVLKHREQRRERQYEVLLKLTEQGAPVPPNLLDAAQPQPDDLRRGIVLVFSGAGLSAFLLTLTDHSAWGIGLIPIFAGVGYILSWKLARSQ